MPPDHDRRHTRLPWVFGVLLSSCGASVEPIAPDLRSANTDSNARAHDSASPSLAEETASSTRTTLHVLGGTIDVRMSEEVNPRLRQRIHSWILRAATAVGHYYERFPVSRVKLFVEVNDGHRIFGGFIRLTEVPAVRITVGRRANASMFEQDWRLTHEFVHLGFPNVPRQHHWIEEGLATYVEPVARARIGWLPEREVYAEWVERMPLGQPEPGDRGLDHTPTWARTYWGGALFWFAADVQIRTRTKHRLGIRHALQAIVNARRDASETWPLRRALAVGDDAVGGTVLRDLYERHRDSPTPVDLVDLFTQLGLGHKDRNVVVHDDPEAFALRHAILFGWEKSRASSRQRFP